MVATSPSTSTKTDAIVVGESWISEHYFTTDATKESFKARVIARRKDWDAAKSEGEETPRSRFTAARAELLNTFARLDPEADSATVMAREVSARLRDILGYHRIGRAHTTTGPLTIVRAATLPEGNSLAIVDAKPAQSIEALLDKNASTLAEPFWLDEKTEITSVARLLSTLFVSDDHKPDFVLVMAGHLLLIAERSRWPEGRYLALDLQLVCERNDAKSGGEVDRALACISADSLAPNADGDIWWTEILSESVKHTVGVSKDLREGVRLSIEIIANEVVRRRAAQGLEPLPGLEAQTLAKQSLRFLYRILFLLYAEASPELGVLPAGAPEYDQGYSLDRLRELTLVDLPTQRSQSGRHLYESLAVLFRLVDQGHDPSNALVEVRAQRASKPGDEGSQADPQNPKPLEAAIPGLTFRSLRADLFTPQATAHINEVGLGNAALQQVLRHLLLSKETKGRDRGFISYAELGINQLGAVYEGLMSYTGFFAEDDLYEVAKDGNAEKGSWVVPVHRADGIADKDYVTKQDDVTGEVTPILHERGSFVFRLAGRERQQSASYYTPEVLTRFVVSQALEELLDQDGHTTSAAEILQLTICEPALGSGAFAIEAVRQLAEEYLKRRQAELGRPIDPDAYPRELQNVKAYLALHQTYGVDLNATAVELAEISLWLDTMVEGLQAPWFGLHLRRGNSLIGARKAVFTRSQVEDKSWLKAVPKPVVRGSASPDEASAITGRIPHFLLPADGWGAAAEVGKDIKVLVPDAVKRLKDWRKTMWAKPTKKQVDRLVELGERVERLWEIASKRLEIANEQIRRDIPLWGNPAAPMVEVRGAPATNLETPEAQKQSQPRHVTREEIEASLADVDGAYRRLRLVMDAWCALWFWPLTEDPDDGGVAPPTLEEWYDALGQILGGNTMSKGQAKKGDDTLDSATTWDTLGDLEDNDRIYAGAKRLEEVDAAHPWLDVCRDIAVQQGFFHWHLDFAEVFDRGGFDLQVGNPPWVRPTADVPALLAEGDPWWQLAARPSQATIEKRMEGTLTLPGIRALVVDGTVDVNVTSEFVGSVQLYPHLKGLQPDLYRCFMEQTWRHQSASGSIALIHPDSHFTDAKARPLRRETYLRIRRHWYFHNALKLFEVSDHVKYGVHVYAGRLSAARFLTASSLYHPDTVERSFDHDGSGSEPGTKDADGYWDLRPHRNRIVRVDAGTLRTWHALMDDEDASPEEAAMVYTVNTAAAAALGKLSSAARVSSMGMSFSSGWHEKGDRAKGYFVSEWGQPAAWKEVILQGPNFHVATPFNKSPNPTMLHNQDWAAVDLERLSPDSIPVTSYKPRGDRAKYDRDYTHWGDDRDVPARDHYRVAWRGMAANTGERTLIPALIPPGTAHINGVFSMGGGESNRSIGLVLGVMGSLLSDFLVRAVPKSGIYQGSFERLAMVPTDHGLCGHLLLRTLRLNCLTDAYADLWAEVMTDVDPPDGWTGGPDYPGRSQLTDVTPTWTPEVPLRRASDRRQALVEIDALVALMLGLSADELCTIYRTQFAVLYGYDRNKYLFDANGREVPNSVLTAWRKRGLDKLDQPSVGMPEEERTAINPSGNSYVYELPFVTLDREADMRTAYSHFEQVLADREAGS
ncbi:class I SAM-dependent DNA methyltransferase [Nocardioides salsibiostraticola]